jgi:hypothetical protein
VHGRNIGISAFELPSREADVPLPAIMSHQRGMNERPVLGSTKAALNVGLWVCSDFGTLRQLQSVFNVNAKVAHRALDLGVTRRI